MGQRDLRCFLKSSVSKVIGLVDTLSVEGGKIDLHALDDVTEMDVDDVGPVIDAAELLGFVVVKEEDIKLTEEGKAFAQSNVRKQRQLVRDKLLGIPEFKELVDAIRKEGELSRDDALATLGVEYADGEEAEEYAQNLNSWGRFAGLFHYESEECVFKPLREIQRPL